MYDANAILQDTVTKTATFTGAGFDLKTGTPRRGLKARLRVTGASGTSPTLDVKVQDSADNTTFVDLCSFDQKTAAGLDFATVETNKRYIRALATIGGDTPSFVYTVELGDAYP
ncbi:MAG: hypothetical protein ACO1SX_22810 [Actinomycetota bacterium]